MSIWAMGDLHLSLDAQGHTQKPMDIFNSCWKNHVNQVETYWRENVKQEDIVLLCGDISWAMELSAMQYDLQWLGNLPGRKILCKGNHDYWWKSITKVRETLMHYGMEALQNDAVFCENHVICASRGPEEGDLENQKVFQRELQRIKLSLNAGKQLGDEVILMLHFPPFYEKIQGNPYTELIKQYGVKTCVFGHLHEEGCLPKDFTFEDTQYYLVSANLLNFQLRKIK